ncbi:phenylalanine--tRNA ligase beta subunit-related protein [Lapidilactobacillus salsurivasis]
MEITIAPELTQVVPKASLLVLDYQAEVTFSSPALQAKFIKLGAKQAARLDLPVIAQMPQIAATRAAYRALGKAQASYRNTAEAMLRRLVKGQEVYQINNVVEINNLMSIFSGFSIGSYNLNALSGSITWRPAPAGAQPTPGSAKVRSTLLRCPRCSIRSALSAIPPLTAAAPRSILTLRSSR